MGYKFGIFNGINPFCYAKLLSHWLDLKNNTRQKSHIRSHVSSDIKPQ